MSDSNDSSELDDELGELGDNDSKGSLDEPEPKEKEQFLKIKIRNLKKRLKEIRELKENQANGIQLDKQQRNKINNQSRYKYELRKAKKERKLGENQKILEKAESKELKEQQVQDQEANKKLKAQRRKQFLEDKAKEKELKQQEEREKLIQIEIQKQEKKRKQKQQEIIEKQLEQQRSGYNRRPSAIRQDNAFYELHRQQGYYQQQYEQEQHRRARQQRYHDNVQQQHREQLDTEQSQQRNYSQQNVREQHQQPSYPQQYKQEQYRQPRWQRRHKQLRQHQNDQQRFREELETEHHPQKNYTEEYAQRQDIQQGNYQLQYREPTVIEHHQQENDPRQYNEERRRRHRQHRQHIRQALDQQQYRGQLNPEQHQQTQYQVIYYYNSLQPQCEQHREQENEQQQYGEQLEPEQQQQQQNNTQQYYIQEEYAQEQDILQGIYQQQYREQLTLEQQQQNYLQQYKQERHRRHRRYRQEENYQQQLDPEEQQQGNNSQQYVEEQYVQQPDMQQENDQQQHKEEPIVEQQEQRVLDIREDLRQDNENNEQPSTSNAATEKKEQLIKVCAKGRVQVYKERHQEGHKQQHPEPYNRSVFQLHEKQERDSLYKNLKQAYEQLNTQNEEIATAQPVEQAAEQIVRIQSFEKLTVEENLSQDDDQPSTSKSAGVKQQRKNKKEVGERLEQLKRQLDDDDEQPSTSKAAREREEKRKIIGEEITAQQEKVQHIKEHELSLQMKMKHRKLASQYEENDVQPSTSSATEEEILSRKLQIEKWEKEAKTRRETVNKKFQANLRSYREERKELKRLLKENEQNIRIAKQSIKDENTIYYARQRFHRELKIEELQSLRDGLRAEIQFKISNRFTYKEQCENLISTTQESLSLARQLDRQQRNGLDLTLHELDLIKPENVYLKEEFIRRLKDELAKIQTNQCQLSTAQKKIIEVKRRLKEITKIKRDIELGKQVNQSELRKLSKETTLRLDLKRRTIAIGDEKEAKHQEELAECNRKLDEVIEELDALQIAREADSEGDDEDYSADDRDSDDEDKKEENKISQKEKDNPLA